MHFISALLMKYVFCFDDFNLLICKIVDAVYKKCLMYCFHELSLSCWLSMLTEVFFSAAELITTKVTAFVLYVLSGAAGKNGKRT